MKFPQDYPYSPPTIRFLTKVWHPNVYEVSVFFLLSCYKKKKYEFTTSVHEMLCLRVLKMVKLEYINKFKSRNIRRKTKKKNHFRHKGNDLSIFYVRFKFLLFEIYHLSLFPKNGKILKDFSYIYFLLSLRSTCFILLIIYHIKLISCYVF